jgi:zinc finger protein
MHSPTSPTSTVPGNVVDSPESQFNAKKATPAVNGNLFGAANKAPFPLKSSAPKEPSKLRFGFAAVESDADLPPPAKSTSNTPALASAPDQSNVTSLPSTKPPTIPSRAMAPTPAVAVTTSLPEAGPSLEPHLTKAVPKDPKQAALVLNTASLPSFSFNVTTSLKPHLNHAKERNAALVVDPPSLPAFAFVFGAKPTSGGFNWEAAGMKHPMKVAGSWKCGVCMVDNDSSKTKCAACEEPRSDSAATKGTTAVPAVISESSKPAAPTGGFNWSAAGLKAPTKAPGTWACRVCMVDNDVAKTKCVSCEEPRPASVPAAMAGSERSKPTNPSGGFNWGAAGLNVPSKTPGTWTCKVCMVDNDITKTKCAACEEPRA